MKRQNITIYTILLLAGILINASCTAQQTEKGSIDQKAESFLDAHSRQWHDMNVPANDGQLLYDLIIENNYKSALEIGTSTGHSTIWMAWAMSKTGGKVITVEIDKQRHETAMKNFEEAGVSEYIDARLADAHTVVPELKGPFDFVFSDADKSWYRNYFLAVDPKLKVNGCYTTHNVSNKPGVRWNADYLKFLLNLPNYKTTVNNEGGGLAISYKMAE